MELDPLIIKLILDKSGYETGLKQSQTTTTSVGTSLKSTLNGVGLSGVASFMGITGAIAGTVEMLRACINTTMEYVETIKKMSLLNGITEEETARLIAVTGRYDVTLQDLNLASRTLAKNGLSLTTDELARMSDAYLALNTAAEQQAFLMENFGARGGTAFVELMQQGGVAIKNQAAAVQDGLIPNQAMLDMQENQKNAAYDLGLAWKAFELQIGAEIIPGLTDLTKTVTDLITPLMTVVHILEFVYKWGTAAGISGQTNKFIDSLFVQAAGNRIESTRISPDERGHAGGTQGWQTVPQGFPGDTYKIGLTSGETYAVSNNTTNNMGMDYRKLARAIRDALNG